MRTSVMALALALALLASSASAALIIRGPASDAADPLAPAMAPGPVNPYPARPYDLYMLDADGWVGPALSAPGAPAPDTAARRLLAAAGSSTGTQSAGLSGVTSASNGAGHNHGRSEGGAGSGGVDAVGARRLLAADGSGAGTPPATLGGVTSASVGGPAHADGASEAGGIDAVGARRLIENAANAESAANAVINRGAWMPNPYSYPNYRPHPYDRYYPYNPYPHPVPYPAPYNPYPAPYPYNPTPYIIGSSAPGAVGAKKPGRKMLGF